MTPIITFTSDFGLSDVYVGVVHGVIAGIAPQARVIDLTHGIPPQDILAGALALYAACPFFPAGTIHLVVVDPGVGTTRRALLAQTGDAWFIGPDNGVFSLVAPVEQIQGCWELTNSRPLMPTTSATFHGRDIFGPVAAHLANGVRPEALGAPTQPPTPLPGLSLRRVNTGETVGAVLTLDHFGNMVTNLVATDAWRAALRAGRAAAWLEGQPLLPTQTYGATSSGAAEQRPPLLLLAGSAGLLEVAIANGSAARTSGLGRGATIHVVIA